MLTDARLTLRSTITTRASMTCRIQSRNCAPESMRSWLMQRQPNPALHSDAPGRHGLCIFHRKGRAGLRRAGKRER